MMTSDMQIIASRNAQLEVENKELYQKINELLTENAALKASRSKFREICQNYVESQTSNTSTPAKEINQKMYIQTLEIELLKQKLKKVEEQAQNAEMEKDKAIQDKRSAEQTRYHEETSNKENTKMCLDIIKSMKQLSDQFKAAKQNEMEINSNYSSFKLDDDFSFEISESKPISSQLQTIFDAFTNLSKASKTHVQDKQKLFSENQILRQRISELETQISVIKTESDATRECNDRYDKERNELTNAITSLRNALKLTKENLVNTEKEKESLKEENIKLKISLAAYSNNF